MKMVKLIGLKRFPYGRKSIQKDEAFEAPIRDARVLVIMGRARQDLSPAPVAQAVQPAAAATEAPPRRRNYRRRDMAAE